MITSHSHPRATINCDHLDEFKTALGSEEKADHMVENFRRFNTAGDRDSIMADGIVFNLIHQHRLGRVVLLQILGIGTSCLKRIRDGDTKNIDYQHLNGFQARFDNYDTLKFCVLLRNNVTMVEMLAKFKASLTVELGYPCSHRRMKKCITKDGIDNFTR